MYSIKNTIHQMYIHNVGIHHMGHIVALFEEETFDLEICDDLEELKICENWFKQIGSSLSIEKLEIQVKKEYFKDIISIIGKTNKIKYLLKDSDDNGKLKDEFLEDIKKIIVCSELKADLQKINNKYKNEDNKLNKQDIFVSKLYEEPIKKMENVEGLNYNHNFGLLEEMNENNFIDNFSILSEAFQTSNRILTNNTIKDNNFDKYIIIFNSKGLFSFVIKNPNKDEEKILDKEIFGFKKSISFNNLKEDEHFSFILMIKQLFDNKFYSDEKEVEIQLEILKSLFDKINTDRKEKDEKEFVNNFITKNFTITINQNERMKANELFNQIENEANLIGFKFENKSFRNKLSKYLLDLGLKKKRYSDGFYYFGLRSKFLDNIKYNAILRDKDFIKNLENERENDRKVMILS